MTSQQCQRPLDGVLVAEAGNRLGVGACGSLLAQLGATVVVLEPEVRERRAAGGKWRNRVAAMAGKLSVWTDSPVAMPLLETADIVLTSSDDGNDVPFVAGTGQVHCDMTAYGRGGPLSGAGASEAQMQAIGGLAYTTGFEDGPPVLSRVPILETSMALYAASAVLAALRVRNAQEGAQQIDMAMYDVAINALANFLTLHCAGEYAGRAGNRHALYAPWDCFRARDGHVLICAATDDQFANLGALMGQADMSRDPRYATSAARKLRSAELSARIADWAGTLSVEQCVEALSERKIPCGSVIPCEGIHADRNLDYRGMFRWLRDPETGSLARIAGSPLRGDRFSGRLPDRVSRPGQDGDAVQRLLRNRAVTSLTGVTGRSISDPLAGLCVVEIGHYTVAPLASRLMGALGATVVKVEPPAGDAIRRAGTQEGDEPSHIFVMTNTDKHGLVLDLREPADCERLHRLLDKADVLIENLRQGALAARGFGPETLRARHPRLISCSVSGFGADSLYPGRPAFDTVIQAMSGLMIVDPDTGTPLKMGMSASDVVGGQFALLAVLAGIEFRDRTGDATHFDISMQDGSAWITHPLWNGDGTQETRAIACDDGYVVVEADQEALSRIGELARGTREHVCVALAERGYRVAAVLSVQEAIEHPHTHARGLWIEAEDRDGRSRKVLASPLRLGESPSHRPHLMSSLGSDDQWVVERFGLDACDSDAKLAEGTK